jgi:hypothetical protein
LAGGIDPGNDEGIETAQRPQLLNRQSADWPWSSWRFYFLGGRSMLEMDRIRQDGADLLAIIR